MDNNELADSIYAFRVSKREKDWLTKEVKAIKAAANKSRPKGTRVIGTNDIILEALKIGFDRIKLKKR